MNIPFKVRITIIKKTLHEDLINEFTINPQGWKDGSIGGKNPNCCHSFKIGHQFISDGSQMPEGFPSPPWVDIQKYVWILGRGGNMLGCKQGTYITNCSDGFRPVTFKLERIQE